MGLRDCNWEVVAIKKADKSQTEFSFDREKNVFGINIDTKQLQNSVCILHLIISTARCFAGYQEA